MARYIGGVAFERRLKERGLGANVSLPGFKVEPWAILGAADVFVLSSDYEGFGNVLVEAMRLGVQVVSTDCESGPAEIVDHGRFGVLTPVGGAAALANGIERTLDRPIAPEELTARAEDISGAGVIRRYIELMSGSIGTRPTSGEAR